MSVLIRRAAVNYLHHRNFAVCALAALFPFGVFLIPGHANAQADKETLQKMIDFRRKLNEFMIKEGVAAILRDSGKPHQLLNMTGSWSQSSPIPTLFVTHEHITLLQRLLKRDLPVMMELNVKSRFIKGPITVYNTRTRLTKCARTT
jgi:hypothetical protein